MCKEDMRMHLQQLRAELPVESTGDRDRSCAESPGTPNESVSELLPRFASETSAVSSSDDKPGNTSIFFARVPPLVPYEHLHELFSEFGTIKNLKLFRRWATAKTSKGCGTVQYTSTDEADAALQALNGVHTFAGYPSCEGPIVVEWMDPSRLTSAEAAAAAAAAAKAKQKEAKAAAAKAQAAKPRSSSKGQAGATHSAPHPPSWTYLQQLNTLAQHNRALAAAATTGAGGMSTGTGPLRPGPLLTPGACVGGLHPAVEAFELTSWRGGPLSPDSGSSASCGLGDPASWANVIPVHLLPMMKHQALPSPASGFNSSPPLLPPAAFTPAAFSKFGMPDLSAQAAAAAAMASNHSVSCSIDRLASAASGSFGCPTPSIEPWFSGGLGDRSSSSFTAAGSNSLWAVMAAAQEQQQRQLQQELEAEQLQQQLLPLMMFEGIASQGCNTSASQGCANGAGAGPQGQATSGTYALFDSASLMAPLNEAAVAAGASTTHSNSILSGLHITSSSTLQPAEVTGFLSGALGQVSSLSGALGQVSSLSGALGQVSLGRSDGYLPLAAGGIVTPPEGCAASFGGGSSCNGQQQVAGEPVTVDVPLSDCSTGQLAMHFSNISRLSGAKLQLTSTVGGGTLLQLCGSESEVEVARNIVRLLSAT